MAKRTPSPLMTPREVAHAYNVNIRTLKTHVRLHKWKRILPCMLDPLRWRRDDVEQDIARASYSRELTRLSGRERRLA